MIKEIIKLRCFMIFKELTNVIITLDRKIPGDMSANK